MNWWDQPIENSTTALIAIILIAIIFGVGVVYLYAKSSKFRKLIPLLILGTVLGKLAMVWINT